jgi:hypothetical protein
VLYENLIEVLNYHLIIITTPAGIVLPSVVPHCLLPQKEHYLPSFQSLSRAYILQKIAYHPVPGTTWLNQMTQVKTGSRIETTQITHRLVLLPQSMLKIWCSPSSDKAIPFDLASVVQLGQATIEFLSRATDSRSGNHQCPWYTVSCQVYYLSRRM